MHVGYKIAASVVATAFVVGIAGRVEAALAQAEQRTPITPQPDLTGLYQVGKASYDFQAPSLKETYTTEPNSKRSLITKVWHPKVWHPRTAVPGGSSASKNPVSDDLARELQASLDKAVQETGIPGATALIISPQGAWFGASGISHKATKTPMLPDDIFSIGSATKSFTAVTVLRLAEQGKLSLKDTLGKWLPDIAKNIPDGRSITIRQLLNGTAGIYNYPDDQQFLADFLAHPQRHWRPEQLVAYAYGKPRFFKDQCSPTWCYPNTGMVLAGMVVEKATGSTFALVLRNQILNPLGLNHTFFGGDEQIVGRQAHGYQDVFKADGSFGQDGIPDDLTDLNVSPFWANGESSPEGGFPAVGNWRTRRARCFLTRKTWHGLMRRFSVANCSRANPSKRCSPLLIQVLVQGMNSSTG